MSIRNMIGRGSSFRRKYLLLNDAFSSAITYFAFALIIFWVIYTNSAAIPQWRLILLYILATFSFCMFFVFTYLMFYPGRMINLRRLLEKPADSYSKPVKFLKLVLPWTPWLILPIVFVTGLIQVANQVEGNVKDILLLPGLIWVIFIPLASLFKLSLVDEKICSRLRIPQLTKLKPNFRWPNSRMLVILVAITGVAVIVIYYLVTQDSSLWVNIVASASVFLMGLFFVYQIVERRINEEKRARRRPVERSVLDGILAHAIAIARIIGIHAGQHELEVKLSENNKEVTKKIESFAKTVIRDGLQLPQSSYQKDASIRFTRLLDDLLEKLFSLQGRYPFVIEEYPDIATILSNLEARQSSIKSAFYWAFLDTKISASGRQQLVEKALVEVVKICGELAEATSKHLVSLPRQ